mgnify:CR=1 FL=1
MLCFSAFRIICRLLATKAVLPEGAIGSKNHVRMSPSFFPEILTISRVRKDLIMIVLILNTPTGNGITLVVRPSSRILSSTLQNSQGLSNRLQKICFVIHLVLSFSC